MDTLKLIESYKKKRDNETVTAGNHTITPPEKIHKKIRTLDYNFFREISPMLRERFEFCSKWENAYLSQDWLSLEEINNWKTNKTLCTWVDLRKENSYPGEPLEDHPAKNIAVYSINPHEPEEIYLIWSDDSLEPRVWHYVGADFYTYNSLERFLLYINGLIGDEDTIRDTI